MLIIKVENNSNAKIINTVVKTNSESINSIAAAVMLICV